VTTDIPFDDNYTILCDFCGESGQTYESDCGEFHEECHEMYHSVEIASLLYPQRARAS